MKRNRFLARFVICMIIVLALAALVLLVMPVRADELLSMKKQNALHEAAELLRAAGYTDDDAVIRTLSLQWWAEEEIGRVWREDVPLTAEIQSALLRVCNEEGVDPLLALGLIETESGFQTDIVSPWGDYGLCQLNKLYFDSPNMTPEENIAAGIGLLGNNLRKYKDVEAALTAYNRGHDDGSRSYARVVLRNAAKWGYGDG